MNRFIYSILFYIILPFILLRLLYRARRAPLYKKRWRERFALTLPAFKQGGIWIHAVSVGESIAATPLVNALLKDYPHLPITITCMTPTGSAQIQTHFNDRVQHCYLPYDTPCMAKHFLKKLCPTLAIVMETELWPNYIHYCHTMSIPIILANARLSERSARGYARFPKLTQPLFSAIDCIASQSEIEAQRFIALGAQTSHVSIMGSIKYDVTIPPHLVEQATRLRRQYKADHRPIWIAASTHKGEDEIILEAHRQLLAQHPDTLLILVPRHPERFEDVYTLCNQHFSVIKRSNQQPINTSTQVWLGDTMGELLFLYALSDIAFVGGSLTENGGHNILEPAALHKPIITGPYLFNFKEISDQFIKANALTIVHNSQELFLQVKKLIENPTYTEIMIKGAQETIGKNQGALNRLVAHIHTYLPTTKEAYNK